MRDYWLTQYLLQIVGWGYAVAVLLALLIAAWAPRRNPHKVLWMLIVLGAASILPIKGYRQYEEQKQLSEEQKQKYVKAKALFDERCKTAGEKIYKKPENIKGLLILNVRPQAKTEDYYNPNWPDAALPKQLGGIDYINAFLNSWKVEQFQPSGRDISKNEKELFTSQPSSYRGYDFIDVKDNNGNLLRYHKNATGIIKQSLKDQSARYTVSYRNLDDANGRENWIAGTVVTIADSQNNETIAEKTWYSFEGGFGSREGERMPWLFAVTCPEELGQGVRYPTQLFSRKAIN